MSNTLETLIVKINADTSGLHSGLSGAASAVSSFSSGMSSALKAVGVAMAAVGTAAVGAGKFIGDSLGVFAGFEDSMKQVAATMALSGDEGAEAYERLSDAAKEAGATTRYSASEAASALNYLALAGYDAAQAAEALPAILNLAAAGGLDLAYASDLVTDSMAALNIEATNENLIEFGDKIARTSQRSNTSVSQLGEAILTIGATAQQMSGGVDELCAALGVLANVGIKGSEGGTALRNMILSLSAPTDKAADALEALGVSAYDANGDLRPLEDTFRDLNTALTPLTGEEKNNVLRDIFNKVDLKSAGAMLAACSESAEEFAETLDVLGLSAEDFEDIDLASQFNSLKTEIEGADGAMEQMSETMESGLNGGLRSLRSAFEGLQIAIAEPFSDMASGVVGEVTELVRDITGILDDGFSPEDIGEIGERVGEFLISGVEKLAENLPAFIETISNILTGLTETLVKVLPEILPSLIDGAFTLLDGLITALTENIEPLAILAADLLLKLTEFLIENLPLIIEVGFQIILTLAEALADALPELIPAIIDLVLKIVDLIIENLPLIIESAFIILSALAKGIIDALPELIPAIIDLVLKIVEILLENLPLIIESALKIITALAFGIIEALPVLLPAVFSIIPRIVDLLIENLPLLVVFAVQLLAEFARGIIEALPVLLPAVFRIITELITGLGNNLYRICTFAFDIIAALIKGIIDALPDIAGIAGDIMTAITGLFIAPIEKAKEWGQNLLKGFKDGIMSVKDSVFESVSGVIGGVADFLGFNSPAKKGPGRHIVEWGRNMIKGFMDGVEEELPRVSQMFEQLATGAPAVAARTTRTKNHGDKNHTIGTPIAPPTPPPMPAFTFTFGDTIINITAPADEPDSLANVIKKALADNHQNLMDEIVAALSKKTVNSAILKGVNFA